jgi:hypothetical protein
MKWLKTESTKEIINVASPQLRKIKDTTEKLDDISQNKTKEFDISIIEFKSIPLA